MIMTENRFIAVVYRQKKCDDCDAQDAGIYNRIDCGCCTAVEVGRYKTLKIARLVAARQAKLKGTREYGRSNGHWDVETDEDGIVATG